MQAPGWGLTFPRVPNDPHAMEISLNPATEVRVSFVDPEGKPVPKMQVLPLPHDQASIEREGAELTRYHFAPGLRRPFLHPVIGPAGR